MSGGRTLTDSAEILWDISIADQVAANIAAGSIVGSKLASGTITELQLGTINHDFLSGLSDDDHTQYALLAGRSGGQSLTGGINASDGLVLSSTANATKGTIRLGSATTGLFFNEVNSRLILGGSGENTVTINGTAFGESFVVHATSDVEIGAHRHTATAGFGASLYGVRSRGTEGAETAVQNNDTVLFVSAAAHDGTDYAFCGQILFEIDGTPGNNDMPGRIVFKTTADGASTTTEAMRINSDQSVQFSTVARPDANDGAALGTSAIAWSDAFLASGGVINWAAGDITITHAADTLDFSGAAINLRTYVGGSTGGGSEIRASSAFSATVPIYAFWFNNNTGIGNPAANTISTIINSTEISRVTSGGIELTGIDTLLTGYTAGFVSNQNAGAPSKVGGCYGLFQFSNDDSCSFLGFNKNRGTTKGNTHTTVQNGDHLGEVNVSGSDGSAYVESGYLTMLADGAVSAGLVPTALWWGSMGADGSNYYRFKMGSDSVLSVISEDAGATYGPRLDLIRASASPAASDAIGSIRFEGRDSGNNSHQYGLIRCRIEDATDGSEDGSIRFTVTTAGSDTFPLTLIGSGIETGSLRINQTPTAVGTGTKTISNAADSSTNLGHYISFNANGTTYYIPCGSVALT